MPETEIDGERVPYIAVGNGELTERLRDCEPCPKCGDLLPVEYGERVLADGTKVPDRQLAFVKCASCGLYLVGINGKRWPP